MHILFITSDTAFFDEKSERQTELDLMIEAATELHIIVFTKRRDGYQIKKIGEKCWIYPTQSWFPFLYLWDGWQTARHQLVWQHILHAHIIISDDVWLSGWLGARLSYIYERVWMVNVHHYYWDFHSFTTSFFKRLLIIPTSALFTNTYHIFSFSEKTSVFLRAAAKTEEEKNKILSFPLLFDDEQIKKGEPEISIKNVHPEFNFIVLTAASGRKLQFAVEVIKYLRQSYRKAGLVVIGKSHGLSRLRVKFDGASDIVRFEAEDSHLLSYLKTTNVYLYVDSGENEDTMLLRAAAASCPILAVPNNLSKSIIKNGVNGYLLEQATPELVAKTIQKFNEESGVREQFKINSGMFLHEHFLQNKVDIVAKLKEYWTFEEEPIEFPLIQRQDKLLSNIPLKEPSKSALVLSSGIKKILSFIKKK